MTEAIRVIKIPEVIEKVKMGRTAIYNSIKNGDFPKQIKLSVRSSGWIESEIDDWLSMRMKSRS